MQTPSLMNFAIQGNVELIMRFIADFAHSLDDADTDNLKAIIRDLFGPTSNTTAYFDKYANYAVVITICYTEYPMNHA